MKRVTCISQSRILSKSQSIIITMTRAKIRRFRRKISNLRNFSYSFKTARFQEIT